MKKTFWEKDFSPLTSKQVENYCLSSTAVKRIGGWFKDADHINQMLSIKIKLSIHVTEVCTRYIKHNEKTKQKQE